MIVALFHDVKWHKSFVNRIFSSPPSENRLTIAIFMVMSLYAMPVIRILNSERKKPHGIALNLTAVFVFLEADSRRKKNANQQIVLIIMG